MIKTSGNKRKIAMNKQLSQAIKHWDYISPIACYPKNKQQYENLINQLDKLLDIVGENENHKLIGLIDTIGHFIEEYDNKHYKTKQKTATGIDVLKFLMEAHNLRQNDLPEIGSQGVVSEILNGKRELNVRQIKLLAKRFNVDPATFIDD